MFSTNSGNSSDDEYDTDEEVERAYKEAEKKRKNNWDDKNYEQIYTNKAMLEYSNNLKYYLYNKMNTEYINRKKQYKQFLLPNSLAHINNDLFKYIGSNIVTLLKHLQSKENGLNLSNSVFSPEHLIHLQNNIPELEYLDLSRNGRTTSNEWQLDMFNDLNNLQHLDLSHSQLNLTQETLPKEKSLLKTLSLINCKIDDSKFILLLTIPKIEELILHENEIEGTWTLEEHFEQMNETNTYLTLLDLSRNRLSNEKCQKLEIVIPIKFKNMSSENLFLNNQQSSYGYPPKWS